MPTIAQGVTQTITVPSGVTVTLVSLPNAEGVITVTPSAPTQWVQDKQITPYGPPPTNKTFGPYLGPVVLTVQSVRGAIDYTLGNVASSYDPTNVAITGGSIVGVPTLQDWLSRAPLGTHTALASPPTVTITSSQDIVSASTIAVTSSSQYMTLHSGDAFSVVNTSYLTAGQTFPGLSIRDPYSVSFGFDGLVCGIQVTSAPGHYYRVIVNDQLVGTWGGTAGPGGGAVKYIYVTFASAGNNRIRVDSVSSDIANIFVGPNDSIWALGTRGPKCLIVADSYVGGAGTPTTGYTGASSWAWTFGEQMGWDNVIPAGIGGAGWIVRNGSGVNGGVNNIQDRAAGIVSMAPDIVIFTAGKNDSGQTTTAMSNAVASVLSTVSAGLPNALMVVTGPMFPGAATNRTADATWTPMENAIFSGCSGFSKAITARTANAGIFTGTGKAGSLSGTGNGDIYIQSDGTHPNQAGCDYAGYRMARLVKGALRNYMLSGAGR